MDGDCLPDIVLICKTTIQIWINKKEKGFEKQREYSLPDNAGPLSFADFNADGTTDLIYGVCTGFFLNLRCDLNVVYNIQKPFCLGLDGECNDADALCIADDKFELDFTNVNHSIFINYTR